MADPAIDPNAAASGGGAGVITPPAPVVPVTTPVSPTAKPPAAAPAPSGGMAGEAARIRQSYYDQASHLDDTAKEAIKQIGTQGGELTDVMKRVRAAQDKADEAQTAATKALADPPKQPVVDALKKLNGLATFVGVFGGLFTKTPMVGSINAAADAMEAYNKGDEKNYKIAYDAWKTQTDMLFKVADMQQSRVKDILYDEQMGLNERRSLLDVTLRAAGLTQLADAARTQGESVILDWQEKMQDAGLKYQEHKDAIEARQDALRANLRAREDVKWTTVTAADAQGKPVELRYNPQEAKFTDLEGKDIDYAPTNVQKQGSGGAPRSAAAAAVQKYMQENPAATSADIQKFAAAGMGRSAAQRSLEAGPMGNQLQSLSVATDHLYTLKALNDAFAGGDVQKIAQAKAAWEREFGNPAPANMDLAAQFVAPELIKAIEGSPGGVAERDEMAQAFKAARGTANVNGAIDTAFALMGGQLNGLRHRVVNVDKLVGQDEFNDMVSSAALDAMNKHKTAVPGEGATKHQVGDVIMQDGKKYKATKVDADGKVTDADEIP